MSKYNICRENREVLIREVQSRPAIWNDEDPNHKNADFVDKNWCEISKILRMEVVEVKSKWKNVRAKMRKELLKMPKTKSAAPAKGWRSTWEYFDMMYFIKDIILAAPATGNLPPVSCQIDVAEDNMSNNSEDMEATQVQYPEYKVTFPDSITTSHVKDASYKRKSRQHEQERLELEKTKIRILEESSALEKELFKKVNNPDYNFLMSLLPFMEPLSLTEKLDLREKLLKEVHDAFRNHLRLQALLHF